MPHPALHGLGRGERGHPRLADYLEDQRRCVMENEKDDIPSNFVLRIEETAWCAISAAAR